MMQISTVMESIKEYLPADWKLSVNGWGEVDLTDRRTQLALAAAGLTTIFVVKQLTKKRYHLPAGPRPWPLVGNLLALRGGTTTAYERFVDMSQIYGDIFTFHFGPAQTIILNSWDAMHEAFHDKATSFCNRPVNATSKAISMGGHSLVFGQYGPSWKVQRKIMHTAFRRFAKGKELEDLVSSRVAMTIEKMLAEKGQPFDPATHLHFLVVNIMASMIFAESFEMDDPFFVNLSADIDEANKMLASGSLSDMFPILEYLPNPSFRFLRSILTRFLGYLEDRLKEHKAAFDPDDIRDFMDLVLDAEKQIQEDTVNDKEATTKMDKEHLKALLKDAFFGGTDTTRSNVHWAIGLCMQYPKMQTRLQQEIDDVIGKDGVITLTNLPKLRYLEAFVREIMRFRPIAPIGVPHATSEDATLGGYTIPKGTMIISNIWALHMDPKLWAAPETFNPDRWLDERGALLPKPNHFAPFSLGRRICPGKAVAEVEVPFIIAQFLQKMRFTPATSGPFEAERSPEPMLCQVENFKVIALPR